MTNRIAEPVMQVGYVVEDLDAGVAHWLEHAGVGPWTVFRGVTLQGRYRDVDTTVTMDVAMGYTGALQIELIQVTSSSPSPYATEHGDPLVGPHHVAWLTDDLEAAVTSARARGLEVLFSAANPSTRVAYLHSADQPGVVFEYIQGDGLREMVAAGIEQARTWDGTDPIRTIG